MSAWISRAYKRWRPIRPDAGDFVDDLAGRIRASLNTILPTITDELDRLKLNGNIAGICDTSLGSYLVIADSVPVPSGALLWSLKPLSTHYDYPGGAGSIMSSLSQVTCLGGDSL